METSERKKESEVAQSRIPEKQILFAVTHFDDSGSVTSFLRMLNSISIPIGWRIAVSICDNSRNLDCSELSLSTSNVKVYKPKENLGYLKGCNFSMTQWIDDHSVQPSFVIVSNTDIRLDDSFLYRLSRIKVDCGTGILAPSVLLENGVNQNPNMTRRISKKKLRLLEALFSSNILYFLLNAYNRMKSRLRVHRSNSNTSKIYACHGSIFILTPSFRKRISLEEFSPLLTGEEVFLAEECISKNLAIRFFPDLIVYHDEHRTTGIFLSSDRRKWRLDSIRFLKRKYFSSRRNKGLHA